MNRRAVLKTALIGAPLLPDVAAQTSALDLTGFGVKGNGSTDDTAAIQKVLNAAAATGGTIRLPAAKYLVAGSLRIPPGCAWKVCTIHRAGQRR
jgi:hypothetical protein